MSLKHHQGYQGLDTLLRFVIDNQHAIYERINHMSAAIQTNLDNLKAKVDAENTVIESAVTLINGFAAQLAAAVAAANLTPEQEQAFADLGSKIGAETDALAAAVAANTPAANPPAPPNS